MVDTGESVTWIEVVGGSDLTCMPVGILGIGAIETIVEVCQSLWITIRAETHIFYSQWETGIVRV